MKPAICLGDLFGVMQGLLGAVAGRLRFGQSPKPCRRNSPTAGRNTKIGDDWPHDQRFRWLVAELKFRNP